ncbi:MAG TPA: phage tail spike protein [Caproicibacter sp.]|nr:phage tail spike protein [Caproicibacter sp.]
MIRLYDRKATDFSTNGIKVLQPISCIVIEEVNGDYSLTITMPMWDTSIQNESIISAPTPKNGNQLFRVYKPLIDAVGNNVYKARHIFYDLLDSFIEDSQLSCDGQTAVNSILSGTGFAGESDITTSYATHYQMIDPVGALLGGKSNSSNGFINLWGGEIERDNLTVRMKRHIGKDRNVSIRYRKNLTGLTIETDSSNVATRIYPTGRAADGQTLLVLPEKYVDSPYLNAYVHPKILHYDYSDIKVGDDMTQDAACAALRTAAQGEFAKGADKPTLTAKVEFVPLETTEEYKNIAVLEKVYLGDTIHVYHEPLGISLDSEVTKYEYDCLTERYNSVELGTPSQMIGASGSAVDQAIQKAKEDAKTTAKDYSAAVQQLNNLMANALGFYSTVVPQPDGSKIFYLHNKPKLADSNIIWKLSVDGLAWTTDGHTWQNGITADGNLVIKTISVIGLVADWIVAGILKSKNGRVYFDLDNNRAAVSRLIDAGDSGIYCDIGTEEPQYGQATGMFLYHENTGKFAQIYRMVDSRSDGVQLLSLGSTSLASCSGIGAGHANQLLMDKSSDDYGHWIFNQATPDGFITFLDVLTGGINFHARNSFDFSLESGDVAFHMNSGGWNFNAGGTNRGSIDSNGWHGWINGYQGLDSLDLHIPSGDGYKGGTLNIRAGQVTNFVSD